MQVIINGQPRSKPCYGLGELVTLEVLSSNGTDFQWVLNGEDIPGEVSSSYTFTVDGSQYGNHIQCRVNGRYSYDTILQPLDSSKQPMVTRNPQDFTVVAGEDATFICECAGDNLTYNVYFDDGTGPVIVASGVSENNETIVHTVIAAGAVDEGEYWFEFSNPAGVDLSEKASLYLETGARVLTIGTYVTDNYYRPEVDSQPVRVFLKGYSEGGTSVPDIGSLTRGAPGTSTINQFTLSNEGSFKLRLFGNQWDGTATELEVTIGTAAPFTAVWNGASGNYEAESPDTDAATAFIQDLHDGVEVAVSIVDVTPAP